MVRVALIATVAAAGGVIAAGALGVATAEAPTSTTAPRTISVQGVATEAIDQSASAVTATTVYRQGMTDAIADGLSKAQFLAGKVGAAVGPVQNVIEDGGYIYCAGEAEYLGAQPDFGSGTAVAPAPVRAAAPSRRVTVRRPAVRHRRRHARKPTAKKANVASCTLSTQVSLNYALS